MLNSRIHLSKGNPTQKNSKILLICPERDPLTNLLKLELSHEGYLVCIVNDGISSLDKFQEIKPELVVLDWSISDLSSKDICRRLRTENNQVSIITINQHHNVQDRVDALDAGANDSMSVPFAMSEFLARVRVQLRNYQSEISEAAVFTFEDLTLNMFTREVYRQDCFIRLTTREFDLLSYFLTHPRQVLTRDQIIERIWGYDFEGDSNNVEVYIRYLRIKLEKSNSKRLIHTVRGVGYVLREFPLN